MLNFSPLAVRLPWKPGPYQEAAPCWIGMASAEVAHTAVKTAAAKASGFGIPVMSHSIVADWKARNLQDVLATIRHVPALYTLPGWYKAFSSIAFTWLYVREASLVFTYKQT